MNTKRGFKVIFIKSGSKGIIGKAINFENVFFYNSMFLGGCFFECKFRHTKFEYHYMNKILFANCMGLKQTFLVSHRFVADNIKFGKDKEVFIDEELVKYWLSEGGKVNGKIDDRYKKLWE